MVTAAYYQEEKSKELEHKSKMFSYGEYEGDGQEKMLEVLKDKVEQVYRSCIGDNEANISTLQVSLLLIMVTIVI